MSKYIIDGIEFEDEIEYQKGLQDEKNINVVRSKYDLSDQKDIEKAYRLLVEKDVFATTIGYVFLKELRDMIEIDGGEVENLPPIKVLPRTIIKEYKHVSVEEALKQDRRDNFLMLSILINVIFLIAIALLCVFAYM